MAIYAISDLHLSIGINKPMDIFGSRWTNYMDRLKTEWESTVGQDDHVIIPGDISWATYLDQAVADFRFINELPGFKYISKGNHDYWWTTLSKLKKFLDVNGFDSISFVHNNSFKIGDTVICGTRGWILPGSEDFGAEDEKFYERELIRLELSLKSAAAQGGERILAALHYPPFNQKAEVSGFIEAMSRYGVNTCIYGHLHGDSFKKAVEGEVEGISFRLVSADYLYFKPIKLF